MLTILLINYVLFSWGELIFQAENVSLKAINIPPLGRSSLLVGCFLHILCRKICVYWQHVFLVYNMHRCLYLLSAFVVNGLFLSVSPLPFRILLHYFYAIPISFLCSPPLTPEESQFVVTVVLCGPFEAWGPTSLTPGYHDPLGTTSYGYGVCCIASIVVSRWPLSSPVPLRPTSFDLDVRGFIFGVLHPQEDFLSGLMNSVRLHLLLVCVALVFVLV